jgi:hypothetical protein
MTMLRDSAPADARASTAWPSTPPPGRKPGPLLMAKWDVSKCGTSRRQHFGVAGNGTLVQFVPVHFLLRPIQPGQQHWISVEVDNGKSMMNSAIHACSCCCGW